MCAIALLRCCLYHIRLRSSLHIYEVLCFDSLVELVPIASASACHRGRGALTGNSAVFVPAFVCQRTNLSVSWLAFAVYNVLMVLNSDLPPNKDQG